MCFEGRVFTGPFRMKEHCDICGVRFEREQGYFLGAMYFSYPAACALIAACAFVLSLFFPALRDWKLILVACLPVVLLVPAIFRYSRIVWMHLDRWIAPDEDHW